MATDESGQALLAGLSSFMDTLTGSFSVSDVLDHLVRQVTGLLGVPGAAVSLVEGGHLRLETASSEAANRLERLQQRYLQGPGVDAANGRTTVIVDELGGAGAAARWPLYALQARKEGIGSVVGIPMLCTDGCIGTLDIFSAEPHAWTDERLVTAGALAATAAAYIHHASEIDRQRRLAEQLQHALDSRVVIEQAKGVLANSMDISVDRAFHVLREYSRSHNATVRDVATAIVELGLRIPRAATRSEVGPDPDR